MRFELYQPLPKASTFDLVSAHMPLQLKKVGGQIYLNVSPGSVWGLCDGEMQLKAGKNKTNRLKYLFYPGWSKTFIHDGDSFKLMTMNTVYSNHAGQMTKVNNM
jgi:hypothetical protein